MMLTPRRPVLKAREAGATELGEFAVDISQFCFHSYFSSSRSSIYRCKKKKEQDDENYLL